MQVLLPHRHDVKLESVVVSKNFLVAFERVKGLQVLRPSMSCVMCGIVACHEHARDCASWTPGCDSTLGQPAMHPADMHTRAADLGAFSSCMHHCLWGLAAWFAWQSACIHTTGSSRT